jgi:hypothetical protein
MKEPFNNNLPTQTNDVIVNPENPENLDSKPRAAAPSRLNWSQFLLNPRNPENPDSKPYAAAHSFPNHRFKLITPAVPKRHTFTK